MDILDSTNIVDIITIKNWQELINVTDETSYETNDNAVFKVSSEINKKIAIWSGDIYKLKADAIVIPINNFIDGKVSIESSVLYKVAGTKYARCFINTVIGCKTSEIRVTDGYDLPCGHILHTVCPRYNSKYESAAINAIYNCYRNSLLAAMDRNIKKIGFSILHLSKYSFPNELALHITARTIRRFLEKHSDYIDFIVLQVTDELSDIYNTILPIYFPRNSEEAKYSVLNTPDDLGNEDGQPTQPDREIRISAFPYGPKKSSSESDENPENEVEYSALSEINSMNRRSLSQTHIAPALLRQSISARGQGKMAQTLKYYEDSLALERRFDRLFRSSKKMDMTRLNELRVFYQCGKDVQNWPLFLVVEKNIPQDIDNYRNEAISYIIAVLERTAKGNPFSIIYAHTQSLYQPSRDFLSDVYSLLKNRYYKSLNCMCMVHPTIYNRGLNWIFTTFKAPDLKCKLYHVTNLRQLYRIVNPSLLELPDFIYQYDKQVGGTNSYNDSVDHRNVEENRKPSFIPTINEEL